MLLIFCFTYTSCVSEAQREPSDSQRSTIDPDIVNQGDLETPSSSDFNPENLTGSLLEVESSDFSTLAGHDFELNTKKIANELSNLTNEELSVYPITSLTSGDIESVFGYLNKHDLTRLLLNVPQEDVKSISNLLGPATFVQVLDRLSEENKTQIVNRTSNSTAALP
jgi:Mg/Co/Ni transporter MgtE